MADWLKAVGMMLIVYGHVAHVTTIPLTPPVYLKQFGVAFYLFATAFTLVRDTRPAARVVFNRLFRVYLFAGTFAVLLTLVGFVTGELQLSNYFPLFGGVNVFFDNFPANPTTWFVGTYLHFMILWALVLRRVRVQPWLVAVAFLFEIPVRMLLAIFGGGFIAYMALSNWIAVFLFGLVKGASPEPAKPAGSPWPFVAAMLGGLFVSALAIGRMPITPTFPFMTVEGGSVISMMILSAAASTLYLGVTWLTFEAARRRAAPAPIRFISRNSVIIFVAHMPIFYVLHPWLVSLGLGYWARVLIQLVVLLPGLAALSELIVAIVRPDRLRDRVWRLLTAGSAAHPTPQPNTAVAP